MRNTYDEILKIWNYETPDDFAIFSELYYEMFGEEGNILTRQIPQIFLFLTTNARIKFNLYGEFIRPNGHQQRTF